MARIAIVNRGEAAMRLIHAVREYREEQGSQLLTVALHTNAESRALFVREADEAYCLDARRGVDAMNLGSPYLDLELLGRALVESQADLAWVGWGFVAERPEFADLCQRLGVTFVGPPGAVMRRLGDKIGAKRLAESAGVPVAAWSNGPVESVEEALRCAGTIGFPLLVKASAGGGGRGIRAVATPDALAAAFDSARNEAASSFGDSTVFLERRVTGARHVEVQIIADSHGTVWPLGVRDCSIQRRNQKLFEESASTALTIEQERYLGEAAARLAQSNFPTSARVERSARPQD